MDTRYVGFMQALLGRRRTFSDHFDCYCVFEAGQWYGVAQLMHDGRPVGSETILWEFPCDSADEAVARAEAYAEVRGMAHV